MWVLLSLDAPHCLERWVLHGMLTIAQVPHTKRNIMRLEDSITQSSVSILDITIPVDWLSVNFTNPSALSSCPLWCLVSCKLDNCVVDLPPITGVPHVLYYVKKFLTMTLLYFSFVVWCLCTWLNLSMCACMIVFVLGGEVISYSLSWLSLLFQPSMLTSASSIFALQS